MPSQSCSRPWGPSSKLTKPLPQRQPSTHTGAVTPAGDPTLRSSSSSSSRASTPARAGNCSHWPPPRAAWAGSSRPAWLQRPAGNLRVRARAARGCSWATHQPRQGPSQACRARSLREQARRRAARHWGSAWSNTSGIEVPGRMSWNCWNSRVSQATGGPEPASAWARSASLSRRSRVRLWRF